jgi:hypothetical protein
MKVVRILHIRAPLVIKHVISKRNIEREVIPERAAGRGGKTIVLEGDTEKPGFVTMRVARCRFSDNYNGKVGKTLAKRQDPAVVPLRKLAQVLREEERSMLLSCVPLLRHNDEDLFSCMNDYDSVIRHFLPLPQKEVVLEKALG